eukprot:4226-Heterococcus_DN1.PRE.2
MIHGTVCQGTASAQAVDSTCAHSSSSAVGDEANGMASSASHEAKQTRETYRGSPASRAPLPEY